MGFPLVENDELHFAFVLLEGLLPDGNLPPEGGSGEGTELDHQGHFCHSLHEIERLVVQGHEGEARCHLSSFRRALGKLVETCRLSLGRGGGQCQEKKG